MGNFQFNTVRPSEGDACFIRSAALTQLTNGVPNRHLLQQLAHLPGSPALRPLRVFLVRNFAVETITRWVPSFASVANLDPMFHFSSYDDSMSTFDHGDPDVVLIALDFRRYLNLDERWQSWFLSRVRTFRNQVSCPIFVLARDDFSENRDDWNAQFASRLADVPGVEVVDPGVSIDYQPNLAEAASSPFYGRRALEVARLMGLKWLPFASNQLVRLVILDLDNTLYSGVLGEDGVDGIRLTGEHRLALDQIHSLRHRGVLVALSSRNELSDVEKLIESGRLSPLRMEDFFAIEADWGSKSDHVRTILADANFSAEHALFIDDNPGELLEVISCFPDINGFLADNSSSLVSSLAWFPGIWRPSASAADGVRMRDVVANRERRKVVAGRQIDLVRQLQPVTTFAFSPPDSIKRLGELSRKTNQFNTNLARLSDAEVAARAQTMPSLVVGLSLSDRFSDSGVVGLISGVIDEGRLVIDEVCLSCRALGRGLEDVVLDEAIMAMAEASLADSVEILSTVGPRNGPALAWLSRSARKLSEGRWGWLRRDDLTEMREALTIVWEGK